MGSGTGWGGIRVAGADGSLDFDGVIVEHAEVGIEVRSETNLIQNTLLTDNGVGILADYYVNSFVPGLSSFSLRESCVVNSTTDLGDGHGIWGRWTDAVIVSTTIEDNDGYGAFFENADLHNARSVLITSNGRDGLRAGAHGDVTLSSLLGGGGLLAPPGLNSIMENGASEVSTAETGFGTLGSACVLQNCPSANRISDGSGFLVANAPQQQSPPTDIPAQRVYWVTTPTPSRFLTPSEIDFSNPHPTDPASGAGRPGGCDPGTFLGSGIGGMGRSASAFAGTGSTTPRELDPETMALLRARLVAMRAALAENPAADTSAALLGRLYALQRLDRDDRLGEYAATRALLASLRARLQGAALPPALRATAEGALTVSLHDLMRSERYDEARAVAAALGPRAELEGTRLALDLSAIGLDEVDGDYASAIARIDVLLARLGPEHARLAADLEATARLLSRRDGGDGYRDGHRDEYRTAEVSQQAADAAAAEAALGGAERGSAGLGAAYPNPFNPVAVIPFTLEASADVRLAVFDVLGREVARLVDGHVESGRHEVAFDASELPTGLYLIRMTVQGQGGHENGAAVRTYTQRITLLR